MDRLVVTWEYQGGIRAGFATFENAPHYFEQVWDGYDYATEFVLKPVSLELVAMAREAREIFVAWELRRTHGKEDQTSRPDIPGQHPRYWRLYTTISETLRATAPLRHVKRVRYLFQEGDLRFETRERPELLLEWHDVD